MALQASQPEIVVGDITAQAVDVIVNAANESLLGGGGVDGAIHRAAGPRLLEHNRTLGGCPTGEGRLTPAFDLTARRVDHIVHVVGPVWKGGGESDLALGHREEDALLAACYDAAMALAASVDASSIAFPAISTGAYGFPPRRAARIAVQRIGDGLRRYDRPQRVVVCCFDEATAGHYQTVLAEG